MSGLGLDDVALVKHILSVATVVLLPEGFIKGLRSWIPRKVLGVLGARWGRFSYGLSSHGIGL